ncbi:MAG: ATP-binding cassette domain-containing protein [Rhodospirillales bacterium]|nr:ATP-binding cassette domain-containing protein [Rhodospirillales bacterium]
MSRESNRGTWRTIRRLEKSIPQVRWYRLELILMSLFVNVFALGLPIFILQVYDRVLPNLGLTTMQFLVIGLIAVMLLDFFLKTARAAVTTYTGARFEHLARVSAVDHILRTPQDVYENDTPGAYLDKVNAIGVVKDFYSSQLGTLMIDLPFAIFFLGMIWFLGGVMVAVPLVLLTLFGIMAVIVGGSLRRAVDYRSQVDNRRYDFLIEIINGIHTVKAQAFKNLLQRRFDPLQEMSARAVRSVAFTSSVAQSLGSTFGQLNMACVIGTGAILVIDGSLTAGELAACTLLSGRAMQPLQSAMGLWTNFQTIRVACDNAASVLELPAEDFSHLPEMPKIEGDLELRDVTFGYEGMDEPLIKDLNLRIKAGEMIGVDGDNSSGRSTLLKLMMGLMRPNDGAVLLDGHDLAEHKSKSYRRQMAFLSAESNVYSGTILDNMTYFRGGKYINKAIKIAKALDLDEEIKRLPEGYGTHVGDGAGGVLPAGFVQRITVIRAMIDDPKVVLFDNANHGLDSNSDKTLMEYINSLRGKTTVVLVTSRPSWLRMADRRFMMSHGDLTPVSTSEQQPRLEKPNPALPAPSNTPMNESGGNTQPADVPQPAAQPEKSETAAAKPTAAPAAPTPATAPQQQAAPITRRAPTATPRPKTNAQPEHSPSPSATPRARSAEQQPTTPPARPAPSATPRSKTPSQQAEKAPPSAPKRQNPQRQNPPATAQPKAQPASNPVANTAPAANTRAAPTPQQRKQAASAPAQAAKAASRPEQQRPAAQQQPARQPAQVQRPATQQQQPVRPARPQTQPKTAQQRPAQPAKPQAQPYPAQKQQSVRPQAQQTKPQTPPQTPPNRAATRPAASTKKQEASASPKAPVQPRQNRVAASKPTQTASTRSAQQATRPAQPAAQATPKTAASSNPKMDTPPPGKAAFTPAGENKKPAPRAAATLRAAPSANKRGIVKPQPPKARRSASFQPAGVE